MDYSFAAQVAPIIAPTERGLNHGYTGSWHRAASRPKYQENILTSCFKSEVSYQACSKTRDDDASLSATIAERRKNGASHDGQFGDVILDAFFNAAFPGLGTMFAPLSTLDVVEVYDQTRSAFHRAARPQKRVGSQSLMPAPLMAPRTRRKPSSVLAFIFG